MPEVEPARGPALVGQEAVVRGLAARLAAGNLPHALLVEGPAGSGKSALCRWLAHALLCRGAGQRPCGACAPCRLAAVGTHPDLHLLEVDRAGGRRLLGVQEVEELLAGLRLAPGMGDRRVALVEEAERLTEEAQNSLLKSLEEPRPGTWLFLEARRPEALLDTVRSRVQRVRMASLESGVLCRVLEQAGHGPSPARDLAVAWAMGSPGLALRLLEEGPGALQERLLEVLRDPAGADPGEVARRWSGREKGPGGGEGPAAEAGGGARAAAVRSVEFHLQLLPRVARAALLPGLLAGRPGGGYDPAAFERLDVLVEECLEAGGQLALHMDPSLVVEAMVVRLARRLGAPRGGAGGPQRGNHGTGWSGRAQGRSPHGRCL